MENLIKLLTLAMTQNLNQNNLKAIQEQIQFT